MYTHTNTHTHTLQAAAVPLGNARLLDCGDTSYGYGPAFSAMLKPCCRYLEYPISTLGVPLGVPLETPRVPLAYPSSTPGVPRMATGPDPQPCPDVVFKMPPCSSKLGAPLPNGGNHSPCGPQLDGADVGGALRARRRDGRADALRRRPEQARAARPLQRVRSRSLLVR